MSKADYMSDSQTLISGLAYLATLGALVYLSWTATSYATALKRSAILALCIVPVSILLAPDTLAPTHAIGRFLGFLLGASILYAAKRVALLVVSKLKGSSASA
jgi:endonuclease/exonuclease/phosphatase (EEP) superfamily protein YafD